MKKKDMIHLESTIQPKIEGLLTKIKQWQRTFKAKREGILGDLKKKNITLGIDKIFIFNYLKDRYPDFCYLYRQNRTCHPLNGDELYCYHCACPHYDLKDSPVITGDNLFIGQCKIKSKNHKYVKHKGIHSEKQKVYILSCEDCLIPHTLSFVQQMDKP